MLFNLSHSRKAFDSIYLIFEGISIHIIISDLQLLKESSSIDVTDDGIEICLSDEQLIKMLFLLYFYYFSKVKLLYKKHNNNHNSKLFVF